MGVAGTTGGTVMVATTGGTVPAGIVAGRVVGWLVGVVMIGAFGGAVSSMEKGDALWCETPFDVSATSAEGVVATGCDAAGASTGVVDVAAIELRFFLLSFTRSAAPWRCLPPRFASSLLASS